MNKNNVNLKLIVTHAKCKNCGFERKIYFLPESSYGERILSTKDGQFCAYANLLEENTISEIEHICKEILTEQKIEMSKAKFGRIVSKLYIVSCDEINGEKIDDTPSWKCNNCLEGEMEEDNQFGERQMEVQIPYVTHDTWNALDKEGKRQLIRESITID